MIQVIKDIIWGWQCKRAIKKANKLSKLLGMKYYVIYMNGSLKVVPKRTIRELVANGLGVSFLYEAVVGQDAQFGHFRCPPLTGSHELNVVYLKNTPAARYAHAFLSSHP